MPSAKSKKESRLKTQLNSKTILYVIGTTVILFLSLLNVLSITKTPDVLGVAIAADNPEIYDRKKYWEDLVSKHPTYYEGWAELYRINLTLGLTDEAEDAYSIAKRIDFNR